jgi:DNA-binding response OmpR family regulator
MARILIVDDEPQTLDLLDIALTMDGHQALRATDGAQCVEMAREHLPDVIVMDQMMPEMDGRTASIALRSEAATAAIPIIMLTSRSSDQDVWDGYRAGVASYLTKPVDLDLLEQEINRLVHAHDDV